MNYNHYQKVSGNFSQNVTSFQQWLFNLLQTGGNTASLKGWENHVSHVVVAYQDAFCEVNFHLSENELLWRYTGNDGDTELFIDRSLANLFN